MNKKIELTDFPYEIQQRIFDLLNEKDHISMHRVCKSWQLMITQYLRHVFILKIQYDRI